MNRSKQNRRLRGFWYKKDLDGWVNFKIKIGRYNNFVNANHNEYKIDMDVWNTQFTHEDSQHYKDWDPYCCNEIEPCNSSVFERMSKTDYGWKCNKCGLKIGRHLARVTGNKENEITDGWDKNAGRLRIFQKLDLPKINGEYLDTMLGPTFMRVKNPNAFVTISIN